MNERIRQLVEQATSIQGPTPYNPLTFEVFDKEKFAQLLVRECADIATINQHEWHSAGSYVLKHFGFEQ